MNNINENVMLDLETLSTLPNAAIVSIAAVYFDPLTGELGKEFERSITLKSAMEFGLVDGKTLAWWMKQSDAARQIFNEEQCTDLKSALYAFCNWLTMNSNSLKGGTPNVQIWGNGATFDNVILSSAYDSINFKKPWPYSGDRDVRTLVELGKTLRGIDPRNIITFAGTPHNALDDAKHQVKYVSEIFKALAK
jgi:exodeoxyribonuclease VIII